MAADRFSASDWTVTLEQKLIGIVKNYSTLFDTAKLKSNKYKVEKKRDWQIVGQQMDLPASACERRWHALREKFCRIHKLEEMASHFGGGCSSSNSAAANGERWEHYHAMEWMRAYVKHRGSSIYSVSIDQDDDVTIENVAILNQDRTFISYSPEDDESVLSDSYQQQQPEPTVLDVIDSDVEDDTTSEPIQHQHHQQYAFVRPIHNEHKRRLLGHDPVSSSLDPDAEQQCSSGQRSTGHQHSGVASVVEFNDEAALMGRKVEFVFRRLSPRTRARGELLIGKLLYDLEFGS